jgi:hypothetical protein
VDFTFGAAPGFLGTAGAAATAACTTPSIFGAAGGAW